MNLINFCKRIVFREKFSSETYINFLRNRGVLIGEDCTIYVPTKTFIDLQYPWMISIGSHVRITRGVIILTHDYSWAVLKKIKFKGIKDEGAIFGSSGTVTIGNNVFIGMNAIIMRNVKIGNNVIIGAGSVITKDCPDNGIYAGNPASFVMTVEEFYDKRMSVQLSEAVVLARKYFERFGKKPNPEVFHEYFMLFTNNTRDEVFNNKMKLCGNYEQSLEYLQNHEPKFSSYDDFLRYCLDEKKT